MTQHLRAFPPSCRTDYSLQRIRLIRGLESLRARGSDCHGGSSLIKWDSTSPPLLLSFSLLHHHFSWALCRGSRDQPYHLNVVSFSHHPFSPLTKFRLRKGFRDERLYRLESGNLDNREALGRRMLRGGFFEKSDTKRLHLYCCGGWRGVVWLSAGW